MRMATPHPSSASACGHRVSRPDALEKDAAQNHDEIAKRNQVGNRLNDIGHVLDRKDESREIHHRYQKEERRRHHRLLLRVRDRRDEQSKPERGQQVDRRSSPNNSQKLPRSGTSNQNTMTTSTMRTSISPMIAVGQELADDQLEPAERRDVQLLERADFALAHDRHRREIRRHDEQEQGKDARKHEVPAFERRVEPHAHARLDAATRRPAATLLRPVPPLDHFLRVSGQEVVRVSQRDVRRIGVRSVRHHLQRCRAAGRDALAVMCRNRERHPCIDRTRDIDRPAGRPTRRRPARKFRSR